MSLKRYLANADNTIANAFRNDNFNLRATGSNMGLADVLEVFSIYGRSTTSSAELSRVLVQFDTSEISSDRTAGDIPASGSVSFYLRLYNAETTKTVPQDFSLTIQAISRSWDEGYGLDLEGYKDKGKSNWIDSKERTSATATIVASTPGSLLGGATFTLTNAAGTTTVYRINGGGSYDTQAGGSAGSTIDIFFGGASTVAHVAEAITKAVTATTNADMTASDNGTNVTIVQTTKGTAGNKTNSDNSSGLTSVGNFTGATGQWTSAGGDYHASPSYTQTFTKGTEDLEVDITTLVEQWLTGSSGGGKTNYGVGIRLGPTFEASSSSNPSGAVDSFYAKRFFARGTEFFFKRPVIEARWDSSKRDDRGDFYLSSALAPASDNLNTLYLYNYVRGRLKNIPDVGTGNIFVNLYQTLGSSALNQAVATPATGGFVSTGIYSCSVCITGTYSNLRDVWFKGSNQYFTGTISPKSFSAASISEGRTKKHLSITNLKDSYTREENARFNLYVRERNWSPTIYTAASTEISTTVIQSASFRLYREIDGLEIVPHATSSELYTMLSHDVSGNYFNFDMSLLDGGYQYSFKFAFYDEERNAWDEQTEKFTFRVLDYEH